MMRFIQSLNTMEVVSDAYGGEERRLSFLNAVLNHTGRKALESVDIVDPKMTVEIVGDKIVG